MRVLYSIAAIGVGLAACETVPVTMDPVQFDAEITRLDQLESISAADKDLSSLLARTDLSLDQRASALLLRGNTRLDAKYNLPGARADFETFLTLSPEDTRIATAERRIVFATSEIEATERRLARLQNLADWFDDKVAMGDLEAAAERYQGSELTPNAAHFHMLRESGFICTAIEADDRPVVHQHGEAPDYATDAVWCSGPSVS